MNTLKITLQNETLELDAELDAELSELLKSLSSKQKREEFMHEALLLHMREYKKFAPFREMTQEEILRGFERIKKILKKKKENDKDNTTK